MERRVLSLAWPVLVQQALIISVGFFDQWLAGHFRPADPTQHISYQSAQTTANYLAWFIASCGTLVSVGATAMVARFVGAKDLDTANRVTHQSLLLAMGFGAVFSVVGLVFLHDLIYALRLQATTAETAIQFLTPILALVMFMVIELAGVACLVGAGDTRIGLYVLGGVAMLNLILAPLCLYFVGFMGIAIGTATSHTVGAIAVLIVLSRGRSGLKLRLPLFRPNVDLMRRLLRISIPASVDSISMGVCQLWFLSLVNQLGETAGAAHGIAIRIESLGYLSGMAFGTAAAALVGQSLGAGRPADASRFGWLAFRMGCLTMTAMGVFFFTFAPWLFAQFCPNPEQAPIIEAGVPVLRLVAFAMPPLSCMIVFTHALRGAGDSRMPMLFTWIGFLVIRLPLAYLLTRSTVDLGVIGTVSGWNLGLIGAWWAMFVDLFVRGAFFLARFASGEWQKIKV